MAVDPSGNIWVADSAHDHVLQFNSSREFVRQIGSEGTGESQFKGIGGIATNSSGDVYVTDTGNDRVQEFSSTGAHLATFGSSAPGNGQLLSPGAIAIDASGNVWVLNGIGAQEGGRIVEFSASGTFLSQFGSKGTAGGQLLYADGLAFSGGHLYVSEVSPHRVQELSTSGAFIAAFDETGSLPSGIATDPNNGQPLRLRHQRPRVAVQRRGKPARQLWLPGLWQRAALEPAGSRGGILRDDLRRRHPQPARRGMGPG